MDYLTRPISIPAPHWSYLLADGMRIYAELHNTTSMPRSFIVPMDDSLWPAYLQGQKLGIKLDNARTLYRRDKMSVERVKMLEDAGILWRSPNAIVRSTEWHFLLADGMRVYQKIYGTTSIPNSFQVAKGDERWPEYLRGKPLGNTLNNARTQYKSKKMSKERIVLLEAAGILWASPHRDWHLLLADGMRIYETLYGSTSIPQSFRVPENDVQWPEYLWNDKIGRRLKSAKKWYNGNKLSPERIQLLEAAGISWKFPGRKRKTDVLVEATATAPSILYATKKLELEPETKMSRFA